MKTVLFTAAVLLVSLPAFAADAADAWNRTVAFFADRLKN
jgi:hypothetical protein